MLVDRDKLIDRLDKAIESGEIDEKEARAILRDYDFDAEDPDYF